MIYVSLFYAFFMAGLFAMGGGMAVIPFLKNMIDTYHWFTADDLSTLIALAEMTPGAIGVNMATYAGFMTAGIVGAIVATIALVTPSVILVCVFSKLWQRIQYNEMVISIFNGIKISVAGLLMAIFLLLFLPLFEASLISWFTIKVLIAFIIAMMLLQIKKIPLLLYLIICAIMGIMFF